MEKKKLKPLLMMFLVVTLLFSGAIENKAFANPNSPQVSTPQQSPQKPVDGNQAQPSRGGNSENSQLNQKIQALENYLNIYSYALAVLFVLLGAVSLFCCSKLSQRVKRLDAELKSRADERKPSLGMTSGVQSNRQQVLEKTVQDLIQRVEHLAERLSYLEKQTSATLKPDLTQPLSQTYFSLQIIPSESVENSYINPYSQIVETYNSDPNSLLRSSIKVSETEESISKRRSDSSQPVVLGKESSGNYWVIAGEGSTEWLVPKSNLNIDPYNLETLYSLFTCLGQLEYSNNLRLLKPAKVYCVPGREEWQLEEPGELEFS